LKFSLMGISFFSRWHCNCRHKMFYLQLAVRLQRDYEKHTHTVKLIKSGWSLLLHRRQLLTTNGSAPRTGLLRNRMNAPLLHLLGLLPSPPWACGRKLERPWRKAGFQRSWWHRSVRVVVVFPSFSVLAGLRQWRHCSKRIKSARGSFPRPTLAPAFGSSGRVQTAEETRRLRSMYGSVANPLSRRDDDDGIASSWCQGNWMVSGSMECSQQLHLILCAAAIDGAPRCYKSGENNEVSSIVVSTTMGTAMRHVIALNFVICSSSHGVFLGL
jgi:hypothetical protein